MAIDWKRNQPIVKALRTWVPFYLPDAQCRGGYIPKTTKGGSFSEHSEGRASDIYVQITKPIEKRIGDELFVMFYTHATALHVDHVIWDHRIWSSEKRGPRPYTGSGGPHTDHVHVAFTQLGSQYQPAQLTLLLNDLRARIYGDRLVGPPPAPR